MDTSLIERWLQHEDDVLCYAPDTASLDGEWWRLGVTSTPVQGEYGLLRCPLCGADGHWLGPSVLTTCTLLSGESGWSHALYCEQEHLYFAWGHEYRAVDSGRHLQYVGTESFGRRYLYSSTRNTFRRAYFIRGVR